MPGLPAATSTTREPVTNPAAAAGGPSYLAVDRIQDSGANPCIVEWQHAFANAGDIADLSTIAARVAAGLSDAIARSAIGMIVEGLVNPGGTVDAARAAGSTGYLLGARATAGAPNPVTCPSTLANTVTAVAATIPSFTSITDTAVRKRLFIFTSTANQAINFTIEGQLSATTGFFTICTVAIVTGSQTELVDSIAGLALVGTSSVTGNFTHLDIPLTNLRIRAVAPGTLPTTGSFAVDYVGIC